jgi:hypothetical protein
MLLLGRVLTTLVRARRRSTTRGKLIAHEVLQIAIVHKRVPGNLCCISSPFHMSSSVEVRILDNKPS